MYAKNFLCLPTTSLQVCFAKGVSTLLICSLTPSTYGKTIASLGSFFFFSSLFPSFRFFRYYGIAKQIEIRKEGKSEEKKKEPKDTIVLPYVEGVSEQIKRVLTPLDIWVVNRTEKWTWSLSHGIKDSIPVEKQTGVVYEICCKDCEDKYIGETLRSLKTRLAEHQRHTKTNALTSWLWRSMRPSISMTLTGKIWK